LIFGNFKYSLWQHIKLLIRLTRLKSLILLSFSLWFFGRTILSRITPISLLLLFQHFLLSLKSSLSRWLFYKWTTTFLSTIPRPRSINTIPQTIISLTRFVLFRKAILSLPFITLLCRLFSWIRLSPSWSCTIYRNVQVFLFTTT
jgi:hypothetical protein